MTPVSIVVPNKNGAGLIGRCVTAALATQPAEIIVVDDRSDDSSAHEARLADATVLDSRGSGFAAAVNTGVAAAQFGTDLVILNSDCFVESDTVTLLAAALRDDPGLGMVGARLVDSRGATTPSHGRLLDLLLATGVALSIWPSRPAEGSGTTRVTFLPLACALVRRSAWEQIGGLDERFPFYFEDHDLCWRMSVAGFGLGVCWDAVAVHEGGASSSQRDEQRYFLQYAESRMLYLRKRYPIGWLAFAAVWLPAALTRSLRWRLRSGTAATRWSRTWRRAATAGMPLSRSRHP